MEMTQMNTQISNSAQERLDSLYARIEKAAQYFLGYPVSKDFDYTPLFHFLQHPVNNLGDPFAPGTYAVDTRPMEQEVVAFFADLFRAPKENWWGYVTNGGSEGNLYALYLAREIYPKGMVYYSETTHYSVQKNIHLLNLPSILIKSNENGEMDYDDLDVMVKQHRHVPAIVIANIGTTMKEAKDDVQSIKKVLRANAIRNHYVHCDGALSGSYSAFLDPKPNFDFEDGADSIAISGHKFIGCPFPSGVVVVKKNNRDRIAQAISYIGSLDTTITGSRNGHSPLFLWYAIQKLGKEGFKKRLKQSLFVAAYAEVQLKKIGIKAWRNEGAITVVFPAVPESIKAKWQLATEDGVSHIICMPNVTIAQIDELIDDLENGLEETA